MNLFEGKVNIYFAGIGGIGMSALARYFLAGGYNVAGYDRTESRLTGLLAEEGCIISYSDRVDSIPPQFMNREKTLVVYTPALPATSAIRTFFSDEGYTVVKRSALLGLISEHTLTVAIAGTHGKTTISTLAAYLLKQSEVDCTAFLGGISRNYDTNLLLGMGDYTVMEADEFDRSFHALSPAVALITSMDPDHLEVYGTHQAMIEAYNIFASRIREGGALVVHSSVRHLVRDIEGVRIYTYGESEGDDFRLAEADSTGGNWKFTVAWPSGVIEDLTWSVPGRPNLLNAVAGISLALLSGVKPPEIVRSLPLFRGVVRRLDVRLQNDRIVYIDDYAHHPAELDFLIRSVREFYAGKIITAAFQPHLFTRTRDHAAAFAGSLDRVDRVFLLPVYPAREEPIKGVTSELIYKEMRLKDKMMVTPDELLEQLKLTETDVFITVGAGDIDRLTEPVIKILEERK
ncbi:MAG: UDP-N-acetylmuramate--L-alanine ligase [Bacteroidales bacterium]|nr:UDP-N-acetylmuramate--L-alanine ligase [Bacteroidales bacterium]